MCCGRDWLLIITSRPSPGCHFTGELVADTQREMEGRSSENRERFPCDLLGKWVSSSLILHLVLWRFIYWAQHDSSFLFLWFLFYFLFLSFTEVSERRRPVKAADVPRDWQESYLAKKCQGPFCLVNSPHRGQRKTAERWVNSMAVGCRARCWRMELMIGRPAVAPNKP